MKKQRALDLVGSPSLFQGQCSPCPRECWCAKSWDQLCEIPIEPGHEVCYWALQSEKVGRVGGVAPRPLPPVMTRPRLPAVTHILGREKIDLAEHWPTAVGVYARNAVGDQRLSCEIRREYLASRGILGVPKVLVVSAEDVWLNRFTQRVGTPFARSVGQLGFSALIGPNLSAYPHSEHRVWLDNRAVGQRFTEFALSNGLPAIFHTYLEDSRVHQDWLVEYLRLNPTQDCLATGFDCMGGNNRRFVRRRIRLLERVQERAGRPLRIVLHNMLTRLWAVGAAWQAFPGRIHLVGRSVLLRSLKGSSLQINRDGGLQWVAADPSSQPGMRLFRANARRLDEAILGALPDFFLGRVIQS
ncbi:hypothetical protein [Tautonia rosea]|uniref:hypothetical protein n=1 Tax=Tautonia rosea TaxID=2728037 RepID=UPI001473C0C8|nr:hypothetical protein [Tautonia rosea]